MSKQKSNSAPSRPVAMADQHSTSASQSGAPRFVWPFALLSLIWLACWLRFWGWYALRDWIDTPFYALDKVPGHFESAQIRGTVLVLLGLSISFILLCVLLMRVARAGEVPRSVAAMMGVGVLGAAVASVLLFPVGAVDVFYYLCELKLVYLFHQNPYLTPFAPTFANDPFARYTVFLDSPAPYGPAWFLLSWPSVALVGFASLATTLLGYKVWSALFVLAGGAIIAAYGGTREEKWLGAGLWLLNPLIWYEAVGNGHNDILMATGLLAAALCAKKHALSAGRWGWMTLPLLAIAILTKPSAAPLIWVFVVWMRRQGWSWRRLIASGLAAIVVSVLLIAPFWAGGAALTGWRQGASVSQGLLTGSPVSLLTEYLQNRGGQEALLHWVRPVGMIAFVGLALLSPWLIRHFELNLALVLASVYLLAGAMFTWYLIPIIGLLSLRPSRVSRWYIWGASLLALQFNALSVWAWFNAPFAGQTLPIHAWEACMLVVPLLLLAVASLRWVRPRQRSATA